MMKFVIDYAEENITMKVDDLLKDLEGLLSEAKDLPVVNKAMIDKNQVADLIADIRKNMPVEIRQAKAIVADRTKIISDAKREADSIIEIAEKKRKEMLDEDELVKQSKIEAQRITDEAELTAQKVKNAANNYINEILAKTDDLLDTSLMEYRTKKQKIENLMKTSNNKRPVSNKIADNPQD